MIWNSRHSAKCWICGSSGPLSGEHKIKKSDLKRSGFSHGFWGDGKQKYKIQGLNSKYLKFPNSICQKCNNSDTQASDKAYDALQTVLPEMLMQLFVEDKKIYDSLAWIPIDLSGAQEVAKYFAKHLGCAARYQTFPIPKRLPAYLAGIERRMPIVVAVRKSPLKFEDESGIFEEIIGVGGAYWKLSRPQFSMPAALCSSFMTQGFQYAISMELTALESIELKLFYLRRFKTAFFDDTESLLRGA